MKILSNLHALLLIGLTQVANITSSNETQNVTDIPELQNVITSSVIDSAPLDGNSTDTTNPSQKFINCLKSQGNPIVQITNDTELIKLLQPQQKTLIDRDTPALCVLVMFYSKSCPFSTLAAPHYNALPRHFPDIKMVAINAMQYPLFNTQNGIVGVPTLLLFHNGRPVVRYNGSEYTIELFSKFISRHTGIESEGNPVVTSADFAGPVTSVPSKEVDILLILSWMFIINCSIYYSAKSNVWIWIVETVQKNWRESEAQNEEHEHED